MLSGFIVMNKISARDASSQLECEREKTMKIEFVVELFMLMRGANLEQAI